MLALTWQGKPVSIDTTTKLPGMTRSKNTDKRAHNRDKKTPDRLSSGCLHNRKALVFTTSVCRQEEERHIKV